MEEISKNFIEAFIDEDIAVGGQYEGRQVHTRFPPEPNGYLHIGHVKALCIDFGTAEKYGGICNLRMDDTNPAKEDEEYVEAIKADIHWLGFDWADRFFYASDYFETMYELAEGLIKKGLAYVCELTPEQMREYRGDLTHPAVSPFRDRPIEENLMLFEKMNSGEIEEGAMVLRAKIDMAHSNMHFRDPIIYRVVKTPHHRTGETWKAYPMYDFAHGQSDFFEGVTHSLCTLEFVPHRPLYDYFVDELKEGKDLDDNRPRQYEFNKLNLNYTLMSKRNLLILVKEGLVNGWDDPRMPTLCGFRRRGYSPESIRNFVDKIGYTKFDALNDFALLESAVREDLNSRATRVSAVINPLKLVVTNYPEGEYKSLQAVNNPERPEEGTHTIEFGRELWIERDDFMEDAPKSFYRLTPGREVRLKNAYIVLCTGCNKDENGNITEVLCEYLPGTKTGEPDANRKVKSTLHWVSCDHCLKAEVRLYDRLWKVENPRDEIAAIREAKGCDSLEAMKEAINTDSLKVLTECYVEKYLAEKKPLDYLQFQRIGYFNVDKDSTPEHLIFNRTVSLKDTWSKIKGK